MRLDRSPRLLVLFSLVLFLALCVNPSVVTRAALQVEERPIAFVVSDVLSSAPSTLYTVDADGQNLRRIGTGGNPRWSPDGKYLVFQPDTTSSGDLYLVNADGSNPHSIQPSGWGGWYYQWSPDGQHLILPHFLDQSRYELYLAKPDGTVPQRILKSEVSEFAWSPDSHQLAVVIAGNVYVTDLTGQKLTRVADNALRATGVAWSPSGKQLLFFVGNDLFRVDVDEKKRHRLGSYPVTASPDTTAIVWSPDGKYITVRDSHSALYLMDADGTHSRSVLDFCREFAWQPDGTHLLCMGPAEMVSLDPETGSARSIVDAYDVALSPDGRQFAAITHQGTLCVANLDGTALHQIPGTEQLGEVGQVAW